MFPSRTTTIKTIKFHRILIKQSNQVIAESTIPSVDYSFSFSLTRCRDTKTRPWHWPNYKYWATCSLVVTLSFLNPGNPQGPGLRGVISCSRLRRQWMWCWWCRLTAAATNLRSWLPFPIASFRYWLCSPSGQLLFGSSQTRTLKTVKLWRLVPFLGRANGRNRCSDSNPPSAPSAIVELQEKWPNQKEQGDITVIVLFLVSVWLWS